MVLPFLTVSILSILLGLIFKFYYKNGLFHNSIYIPISTIGIVLLICTFFGFYNVKHTQNIFELRIDQIEKIEFTDSYGYKDSLPYMIFKEDARIALFVNEIKEKKPNNKYHQDLIWDIDIKITTENSKKIYATIVKTSEHIELYQIYRFLFIPVAGQVFVVSKNIEQFLTPDSSDINGNDGADFKSVPKP